MTIPFIQRIKRNLTDPELTRSFVDDKFRFSGIDADSRASGAGEEENRHWTFQEAKMSFCTIKCAVCGEWMSRTLTKTGKPYLYCGRCGVGFMVLRKETAQTLDTACQNIEEKDLPAKTLEKHRQRQS